MSLISVYRQCFPLWYCFTWPGFWMYISLSASLRQHYPPSSVLSGHPTACIPSAFLLFIVQHIMYLHTIQGRYRPPQLMRHHCTPWLALPNTAAVLKSHHSDRPAYAFYSVQNVSLLDIFILVLDRLIALLSNFLRLPGALLPQVQGRYQWFAYYFIGQGLHLLTSHALL